MYVQPVSFHLEETKTRHMPYQPGFPSFHQLLKNMVFFPRHAFSFLCHCRRLASANRVLEVQTRTYTTILDRRRKNLGMKGGAHELQSTVQNIQKNRPRWIWLEPLIGQRSDGHASL